MRKVKITSLPKQRSGGHTGDQAPPVDNTVTPRKTFGGGNDPEIKINRTLQPTTRENATLEAEVGETVITNLQGEGIPEFYKIAGKRHSQGGTPLNLPANSFIFSRDNKLKIKDPEVLALFGKITKKKKGFTPADLSKKYDLNEYREILANPFSDTMQRETAERMIQNYNMKLGALALAQESLKGFDNGIPAVSMPYLEANGIKPEELISQAAPTADELQAFKKGGEKKSGRKVKITGLPQYNRGGGFRQEVQDDGSIYVINRRNQVVQVIPPSEPAAPARPRYDLGDDAVIWDSSKEGFDNSKVEAGDYVMSEDGTVTKVTGRKVKDYDGEYTSDNANLTPEFQKVFGQVKEMIETTPGLKEDIIKKYREKHKNLKPGKNLTQKMIDEGNLMTDEDIISNFYDYQVKNLAVANKVDKLGQGKEAWDHQGNPADKILTDMGFEPNDPAATAAFQDTYIAIQELSKDPKYKDVFKDYKVESVGNADEGLDENQNVSGVDSWYGNTTAGQLVMAKDNELVTEAVEALQEPSKDPETKELIPASEERAKFWTQDLANIGLGLDALYGIEKRLPWQARPQFKAADPTFTDFRGTAARINAQAAGLGAQCNSLPPAQRAACLASVQRQSVNPILQAQEQEARTNVGIANQFELANTQALNAHNKQNAGLATQLYDKTQIANQAFDNAKMQAKQNLVNQLNSAWTNRGKTQSMNAMRDDFAVDPVTGYTYKKDTHREIDPGQAQKTALQNYRDIAAEFGADNAPEIYGQIYGKPKAGASSAQGPGNYPGTAYTQGAPGSNKPPRRR